MGLAEDMKAEMQRQFEEYVATTCVNALRQTVSAHIHTGAMYDSIGYSRVSENAFDVGVTVPYAKYVDQGRGPVRPKKAKALWNARDDWGPYGYAGPVYPRRFIAKAVDILS